MAAEAVARGLEVTALTRNPATASELRRRGVRTVVGDVAGSAWHDDIPTAPDFVLDCVGAGGGGLDGYRHSYLGGMASILAWARTRGGVGTFVYTSSTSVYPQDGGVVVTEDSVPLASESGGEGASESVGGGERGNGCESERGDERRGPGSDRRPEPPPLVARRDERREILRETERLLASARGVCRRWFVLRLAGIYGPGRHHLLDQVRAGSVSGAGEPHLNLIHRDDVVAAILACLEAALTVADLALNVADDGAARKGEIVAWLAHRMLVPPPGFTGFPAVGRRAVTPDRIIANDRIKSVLAWRPRYPSFREGYAAILNAATE